MDFKENIRNSEYKNPRLEKIIQSLEDIGDTASLRQDSKDVEQLKPIKRLRSIEKVWLASRDRLGKPKTAIDAGSGFGYGTVFLDTVGLHAVGVEKVQHKIDQGLQLFERAGVSIARVSKLDFSMTPSVNEADLLSLSEDSPKVDLITMFYLSGEMAMNPMVIEKCRSLLNKGGKLLMSTEVSAEQVETILTRLPIVGASVAVSKTEGNFEQTVILVEFQ